MRQRPWSLSRWRTMETVTLSRVALGGRIPAVYDQRYNCHNFRDGDRRPPATMFTHLACCSVNSRHIGLESRFLPIPPACDAPVTALGGFPSEYCYAVWHGKTRMAWLPDGEKISKISLFVLTWSTNVTDTVGCVTKLVERRSLTGELPCPALDLQLLGDHLCG